ncbi:hypothetical protein BH10PAT3_BH10PAT3_2420 [soil metagenome]
MSIAERVTQPSDLPPTRPRYDISHEQIAAIEHSLIEDARNAYGEGVTASWIEPGHDFANYVRTQEALNFPEVTALRPEYDNAQSLLVLVDTRRDAEQVLHAATIMHMRDDAPKNIESGVTDETGFYTIDSLIKLGNFTASEFLKYYTHEGIDLERSIAAETNFKIHSKMKRFYGMGSADLVYLTLYNQLIKDGAAIGRTVVFATANDLQQVSLRRAGLNVAPLMGRTDFHTEESNLGKESKPMAILIDENCYNIFGATNMHLPELYYPSQAAGL